jgi:hypothetical protein
VQNDSEAETFKQIITRWPDLAKDDNYKEWLGALGWKSATELNVLANYHFRTAEAWMEVHKVYRIENGKLGLVSQSYERLTQAEEDRRFAADPNRGF